MMETAPFLPVPQEPGIPATLKHRIAEVGSDLWNSSGPNPLLKQGHLEPTG